MIDGQLALFQPSTEAPPAWHPPTATDAEKQQVLDAMRWLCDDNPDGFEPDIWKVCSQILCAVWANASGPFCWHILPYPDDPDGIDRTYRALNALVDDGVIERRRFHYDSGGYGVEYRLQEDE